MATDAACVAAARIALATLKEGDPIPRYCELLGDRSPDGYPRSQVVCRLGERPDPRAIPHLLRAIRTDPDGGVVDSAIDVLAGFSHPDAVAGLIACFGAEFAGKDNGKAAYAPEMFQDHIAESLRKLTGENFGPDPVAWGRWWDAEGRRTFRAK